MKRILTLICALLILLTSGCTDNKNRTNSENQPKQVKDVSYRDIECAKASGYKRVYVSSTDDETLLNIFMPKEWTFEKSDNGYIIFKDSKQIGTVSAGIDQNTENNEINVFDSKCTYENVNITHNINRLDSGLEKTFRRIFTYSYEDSNGNLKSITVTIPYEELDGDAVLKMLEETKTTPTATKANIGVLRITDTRSKILILGNSFINTSNIGNILQDMCGSLIDVEAHSRGYATVTTYTSDPYLINNIRDGNYSAVFMCGFYNTESVTAFGTIVRVCKASNTKLAIFPAHNENRSHITSVCEKYSYPILLDWKAEIDEFINSGINYYEFCIDDQHQHSTPLAGYVGAHMIYRAIFNSVPQVSGFSAVSQNKINLLGEYVSTGSLTLTGEDLIYYID